MKPAGRRIRENGDCMRGVRFRAWGALPYAVTRCETARDGPAIQPTPGDVLRTRNDAIAPDAAGQDPPLPCVAQLTFEWVDDPGSGS